MEKDEYIFEYYAGQVIERALYLSQISKPGAMPPSCLTIIWTIVLHLFDARLATVASNQTAERW